MTIMRTYEPTRSPFFNVFAPGEKLPLVEIALLSTDITTEEGARHEPEVKKKMRNRRAFASYA